MKTAYIFHDAFNDPRSDWYPWMKTTLEGMGYVTTVPKFPTPAGQSFDSWKAVVANLIPKFDQETLIIGHGVGGTLALRILEELPQKIRGVFLVASYAEPIGHAGYDRLGETFVKHEFNWSKIKQNAEIWAVYGGSDDPFVPAVITEKLAKNLGETAHLIPDAGHLTKASGFTQAVIVAQGIQEGLRALDRSIVIEPLQPEEAPQEISEPVPQSVSIPAPEPLPAPVPVAPKPSGIKARTMYKDMSELVNSNQGNVTSSLLGKAREITAEKKERSPLSTKNILYIIGTIFMVLLGTGLAGYVFFQLLPAQQNMVAAKLPSLIPSENVVGFETSGKTFYELELGLRKIFAEPLTEESMRDVVYLKSGMRASFAETLDAFEIRGLPEILRKNFLANSTSANPVFMHGIMKLNGRDHHFLVLPFDSYNELFEGMREWEPTLFQTIGIFMDMPQDFLRGYASRGVFNDELINNREVRTLRYISPAPLTPELEFTPSVTSGTLAAFISPSLTSGEEAPLIPARQPQRVIAPFSENELMVGYFFLNQNTLIIVDNLDLIPEIITRWANRQIYE